MTAFQIVVVHEAVEIALDFVDADIPGLTSLYPEAFVEERSVHSLDEAVRPRRPDLGGAVLDIVHGQKQFVRMLLGATAEFPAIVGQDSLDWAAECFIEWHDAIIEQIGRGDGHLRVVGLGEGERAEDIDDDLDVDLTDTLERTQ